MSQKLFIPSIGDEIWLAEDWSFELYPEHRNKIFGERAGYGYKYVYARPSWTKNDIEWPNCNITLPQGTMLKIDRIYIKSGQKEFDSITFKVAKTIDGIPYGRFWVKLADANKIVMRRF
jgi:hypothetical protein